MIFLEWRHEIWLSIYHIRLPRNYHLSHQGRTSFSSFTFQTKIFFKVKSGLFDRKRVLFKAASAHFPSEFEGVKRRVNLKVPRIATYSQVPNKYCLKVEIMLVNSAKEIPTVLSHSSFVESQHLIIVFCRSLNTHGLFMNQGLLTVWNFIKSFPGDNLSWRPFRWSLPKYLSNLDLIEQFIVCW